MRRYGQYQQAQRMHETTGNGQRSSWLRASGRILIGVSMVGVVLAIGGAGVLLYRWMDAPVLAVAIVSPLQRVKQIEVESITASAIDGGFLSLDLDGLQQSLEAHPWVAEATVRRYWPGRIEISIVEQVPIAGWGRHAFVNQRGQLSPLTDNSELASLPHLSGPQGSVREVMSKYRDISELLLTEGLKVSEFGMDKHHRWQMQLDSGFLVNLGEHHVLARVRRFLQAWRQDLELRKHEILAVDARYENGVAVSWR